MADIKVSWLAFDVGSEPVDVKVSWVAFDTAALPVDVRVSWIAFDTAAAPVDVRVSWVSLDTAAVRLPSNEVELKKWYVKRKNKLFVFANSEDADAFIDAEQKAKEAIEKAQRTSRRARKRLKDRVFKVAGVAPVQTIEIDRLGEMVGRFNVPVNLPEILAQQDYAHVLRILEAVMMLQDDEDVELLLLG